MLNDGEGYVDNGNSCGEGVVSGSTSTVMTDTSGGGNVGRDSGEVIAPQKTLFLVLQGTSLNLLLP